MSNVTANRFSKTSTNIKYFYFLLFPIPNARYDVSTLIL